MQVTTELLTTWFTELNAKYFKSELPLPRLETGNSRTVMGTMRRTTKRIGLLRRKVSYAIRLSNYYDISSDEFRNVLLHEMIHYYIAVKNIKDTSPHGVVFRRIMEDFNADGWHITVREKRKMPVAKRNTTHRRRPLTVLAVTMRNGEKRLSVVNDSYVDELEAALHRTQIVAEWSWRTSEAEVFYQWPRVRSLRARRVGETEYEKLMALSYPKNLSR